MQAQQNNKTIRKTWASPKTDLVHPVAVPEPFDANLAAELVKEPSFDFKPNIEAN